MPQQPEQPPQQRVIPPIAPVPPQCVLPVPVAMNWCYLSPNSWEGLEAHLHRTIDWMETHNFAADQRVRRFLLTLAGEARLWYQSIHPFQDNLEELQERIRTQFSKIGNAREQLFHT